MIENPDPYDVLGVTPSATSAQISHAFRTKLRALHPDTGRASSRSPDDADAQLQQLLRAYDKLRRSGRHPTDADPVKIPVTYRRQSPSPPPQEELRAGPVRRHR